MTAFENLKSQWENQPQLEAPNNGPKSIMDKMASIKKKQQITNGVLSVVLIVLIVFFFYISAYKVKTVMVGLLLMIGVLAIRIIMEVFSVRAMKKIDVSIDNTMFGQHMIKYHKKRVKVHFIATPLIIIVYCIGFVMLLPSFKATLSAGFYNYIVVSSIVLVVVFGIFIVKQIKKELLILDELKT